MFCSGYITTLALNTSLLIRSGLSHVVLFEARAVLRYFSERSDAFMHSVYAFYYICLHRALSISIMQNLFHESNIGHLLRNV